MNPVRETKTKKKQILTDIRKLSAALRAGTLDRKKLESGLKKMQGVVTSMPDHDDWPRGPGN
jgi:hypothetical protein